MRSILLSSCDLRQLQRCVNAYLTALVNALVGKLKRLLRGIYELVEDYPETRVISKTVLPGGYVKWDIGNEVLTLTPAEDRTMAQMSIGAAGQAVQRRLDRSVAQIQSRRFHLRLGRLHLRLGRQDAGGGVVQILLADRVLLGQRFDPRQGLTGASQQRFLLGQNGLGIVQRGLEGLGIELE